MACRHGASLRVADEKVSHEREREEERERERERREIKREGESETSTCQDSKAAGTCLRRWRRIVAREIRRKDAITNRIINEVFTGVCIAPGMLISGDNRPFPSSSSKLSSWQLTSTMEISRDGKYFSGYLFFVTYMSYSDFLKFVILLQRNNK